MNETTSLESLFPVSNLGYLIGVLKQASGFREGLSETDQVPALAAVHALQAPIARLDEELSRRGHDRTTFGGVEDDLKWIEFTLSTLGLYLNRIEGAVDGPTAYVFASFLEMRLMRFLELLNEIDRG